MGPRSASKQVGEGAQVQVCSTRLCTCTWHLKAGLVLSRPGPQSTANCWFDGSWRIQAWPLFQSGSQQRGRSTTHKDP